MKIEYGETGSAGFYLEAHADGRWDGDPKDFRFEIAYSPITINADRMAVAATLLFGNSFGGLVDFGSRINLVTADAIRQFCSPVEVYPSSIDEGPKQILTANHSLVVREGALFQEFEDVSEDFSYRALNLLPSSNFKGTIVTARSITCASNSWKFDVDSARNSPGAVVAAAIIVANDLDCGEIMLDSRAFQNQDWLASATSLLSSVGLSLSTSEAGVAK